ncbi:MAG: DegT/DnrJ/EryC1/StrS aminotransferase family protein [Gallionella sp.]
MSTLEFALFGAEPTFAQPMPVGQRYFPSWDRYQDAFRGIFERQYYTEYGPLNQQLEQKLQQFLGVKNAICVTNETVGMMMVAGALGLTGKVILPELATAGAVASLRWAGLDPVICGVNPETLQIDVGQVGALIDDGVSAIFGMHAYGGACDVNALVEVAESRGVQLYFDASHAFGCEIKGTYLGNFGIAEVFSFHQDNILNATEGGCVCTNDDELAARLRTMRSSAGAGRPVEVAKTVNGRMAEAQCAIALLNLEDFAQNRQNNETLHLLYETLLATIPGMQLVKPGGVSYSNYQNLVCRVDENDFGISRDRLVALLKAENVDARRNFRPGLHRGIPFEQELPQHLERMKYTDSLSALCVQLPIGALVSAQDVERICAVLSRAHQEAPAIRKRNWPS